MCSYNPLRPLTQLHIYLARNCSLTCSFCRVSPQIASNGHHPYLSLEKISQAVREALPLGLSTLHLSGGEPFLHPGFDGLLDSLESQELSLILETGGVGLTEERATRLARLPQCKVMIGLDSADPAAHDALHNAPGAFETISRAIRWLAGAGLAPQIVYTVTRQNMGQIPALIRLVEGLGGGSIHFTSVHPDRLALPMPAGIPQQPPTDTLMVEELIALGRKVERMFSYSTRLRLSVDLPPAFRGLQPQASIDGQGRCAILNSLSVLPGGEYALCGVAAGLPELVFGRVGEQALDEIWSGHPFLDGLRAGLPDRLEGVCSRCVMKSVCLGYCAAENYLCSSAFWGPNWFCQSAE
jgi:SynChlorMet cassette radical SAM/SPASM protein ScmF